MAEDFTNLHNPEGGPILRPNRDDDPAPTAVAHGRGAITEDSAIAVYTDMIKVAERDLAGDPNRLAARIEEIRAHAAAAGRTLPAPDPRTPTQQIYDRIWSPTVRETGPGQDGYPAAIQPGQVELWSKAPDDNPPDWQPKDKARTEALKTVSTWLDHAASREKAAELIKLAEKNTLVLRGMIAYAHASNRYKAGRPA